MPPIKRKRTTSSRSDPYPISPKNTRLAASKRSIMLSQNSESTRRPMIGDDGSTWLKTSPMFQPNAPLLQLPRELREQIYGHVLAREPTNAAIIIESEYSGPPLLRVSKQVRAEAAPLYLQRNTFHWTNQTRLRPWINGIGWELLRQHVRSIKIDSAAQISGHLSVSIGRPRNRAVWTTSILILGLTFDILERGTLPQRYHFNITPSFPIDLKSVKNMKNSLSYNHAVRRCQVRYKISDLSLEHRFPEFLLFFLNYRHTDMIHPAVGNLTDDGPQFAPGGMRSLRVTPVVKRTKEWRGLSAFVDEVNGLSGLVSNLVPGRPVNYTG